MSARKMAGEAEYPLDFKLISWIPVTIATCILGIILLRKNRKILKDFKLQRQFNTSLALLYFCFATMRFLFLLSDMERVANGQTDIHYYFVYSAQIIGNLGNTLIILYFDKILVRQKRPIISTVMFSYLLILIILFFLYLFNPFLAIDFKAILYPLLVGYTFLVVAILVLLILRVVKAIKIQFSYSVLGMVIGILCLSLGQMLDSNAFYDLLYIENPQYVLIPPISGIIGLILMVIFLDKAFALILDYFTTKLICLIHRGDIEGKVYLCPKCRVKYCENCFVSVIKVEGKCWACDHVFPVSETSEGKEGRPLEEHEDDASKKFKGK
ncbi:MAG: hypothetical protein ACFFCS_09170 [Candidatus Hodarchaeota archaeon]